MCIASKSGVTVASTNLYIIVALSHSNVGPVDIAHNGASLRRVIGVPGYQSQWIHKWLGMVSKKNFNHFVVKDFESTIRVKRETIKSPFGFASKQMGGSQTMCLFPPAIDRLDPFASVWIRLDMWFPQLFDTFPFACRGKKLVLANC